MEWRGGEGRGGGKSGGTGDQTETESAREREERERAETDWPDVSGIWLTVRIKYRSQNVHFFFLPFPGSSLA